MTDTLVERLHATLRDRILRGDLPQGTRLRQESLAEDLGVSRTPLREALRLLAAEGFVSLRPHRGAIVVSAGDMEAAWRARLVVEPPAAVLAARHRLPEALEAMAEAIARQRSATEDTARSFDANRDFHVALVRAGGNPHLIAFVESLWITRIGLAIYRAQAVTREQDLAYADEHEQILRAVDAGDGEAAKALTRAHIAAAPPLPAGDGG